MNREMNLMLELYISYEKKFQHAIKNSLQTNEKKKKTSTKKYMSKLPKRNYKTEAYKKNSCLMKSIGGLR